MLESTADGRFPWWAPLGGVLLACLYLPTLATPFDFNDDGGLAYPTPNWSLGRHWRIIWDRTLSDFRDRGPFRPMTWAHWETAANVLGPHAPARRLVRLAWAALAAAMLLWLFRELRLRPGAALLAATLAMASPYRNEIWLGLGLTEALAMPYALFGLICAVRAARSARPWPWPWDLAGALAVLAARGCKNTFAALVPAQVLLRLSGGGLTLREGWRRQGWRACLLALTLLLPATHFIVYKMYGRTHSQLGWYTTGLTWVQLRRMPSTLAGAISLDFMGLGIALMVLTLALARWRPVTAQTADGPADSAGLWQRYRVALLSATALFFSGVAIYLPINGVAGRYTMPAIWGVDILVAVLLTALADTPQGWWRRAASVAFGCGLAVVVVANLGKQDRFAARAGMLWQALECIERQAPAQACVAWPGQPGVDAPSQDLQWAESIHFGWHLQARGRADITIRFDEDPGRLPPILALRDVGQPPGDGWHLLREFRASYWLGQRCYCCCLWARGPIGGPGRSARAGWGDTP